MKRINYIVEERVFHVSIEGGTKMKRGLGIRNGDIYRRNKGLMNSINGTKGVNNLSRKIFN